MGADSNSFSLIILGMRGRAIAVGLVVLAGAAEAQIPTCLTRGGPFHVYREEREKPLVTVVRRVRFTNVYRLPITEQQMIARSLLGRQFKGSNWLHSLGDEARGQWQERGYFKAEVAARYRLLSAAGNTRQVAVTVEVKEGTQYRLGALSIKNGKVFYPRELEGLVPLKPGDILNTDKVRQGLEALRRTYTAKGYLNFTSVPDTQVDEDTRTVALVIELDEGPQFTMREMNVFGLDPATSARLHEDWKLKPGDPFNGEYLERFWTEHESLFPPQSFLVDNARPKLDERTHVVDVILDFRPPRDDTEVCGILGIDPRLYEKISK